MPRHSAQLRRLYAKASSAFAPAIDAVQGVLWTNTADGEMRGEQPSWAALTGQTVAEYQGFGWAKAVHPDDAQPTIDAWLIAVRERRTFVFEHRVRRHDGVWRAFSIRAIPVLDAAGAIREWVGVHTDISEQRESERALRASEGRYRAIQDTSIDGFMVARECAKRRRSNRRFSFGFMLTKRPNELSVNLDPGSPAGGSWRRCPPTAKKDYSTPT